MMLFYWFLQELPITLDVWIFIKALMGDAIKSLTDPSSTYI